MSRKRHRLWPKATSVKVMKKRKKEGRQQARINVDRPAVWRLIPPCSWIIYMLTKTRTRPQTVWLSPKAPQAITPYSLTLVLAYLQYYTPKRLQNGRFLAVQHLRRLAAWINHPAPRLRAIEQHKILALHLALLRAAGFIPDFSDPVVPQPAVTPWLHATAPEALACLLQALDDAHRWEQACSSLNLHKAIGPDQTAYARQCLSRQLDVPALPPQPLQWRPAEAADAWRVVIPPTLPRWLHFDLRQLGEWSPESDLICTPVTIASAVRRGYSPAVIQWLLETAAQADLPPPQRRQLQQWTGRARAYKVRTVQLLSTAQPEQLAAVLRQKRLRDHVIEHLSPRHAIVSAEILPQLEKWLAGQNYPLQQSQTAPSRLAPLPLDEQTAVQWLGVRLLIGLGEILHRPYPSPHALMEQLDARLEPAAQVELEAVAANLLAGLREAIRGRDAYLPAHRVMTPETIHFVEQALREETSLQIHYQPLGDTHPSWREIQPLRLEQRGNLHYLYAYCLRAETNLTFRLDCFADGSHLK